MRTSSLCARTAAEQQTAKGVTVRYVRAIWSPRRRRASCSTPLASREDATHTARLAHFAFVCVAAAETTENDR